MKGNGMNRLKKTAMTLCIAVSLTGVQNVWAAEDQPIAKGENGQWLTTVQLHAGTGELGETDGAANAATFRSPNGLLLLEDGSVLVSDEKNQLIRRLHNGQVETFAGVVIGFDNYGYPTGAWVDGDTETSLFREPAGMDADSEGNIYVADAGNHAIRKIDKEGKVTTIAGHGIIGHEDGKGDAASFYFPQDVAAAADGTLYVADTLNHSIRKITSDGTVTTISGVPNRAVSLSPGQADFAGDYRDGTISEALFNEPSGLALDEKGNLYVSDKGNQRIRYIDFDNDRVSTVAGASMASAESIYEGWLHAPGGFADGDADQALFNFPKGIALTKEGGLFIADSLNHSIRYLYEGRVTTIAGDIAQYSGKKDGIDRYSGLQSPSDVAVLPDDTVLVADAYNNSLRLITPYRLAAALKEEETLKIFKDEKRIEFDTDPEISNGRTMVPVRAITEALGFEVKFLGEEQIVQLSQGDKTIELYVGQTKMRKLVANQVEKETAIDASPYIKNDRTYVPLRFFSEELGLDVQWIGEYRAVILRAK
jgi:sugar lactone lactonase YvrE